MPPSLKEFDTFNEEDQQVRLKVLCALAFMLPACGVGFAAKSPGQQYSKLGINRMFVDARTPDYPPKYSRSEIKRMIHDAKTSEDCERLADYFDFRAMELEQKSQDQLKELERLLALRFHAKSYPARVDSTLELMRRYKAQAQECSARADAYREHISLGGETR
jgi:hypothetical protein